MNDDTTLDTIEMTFDDTETTDETSSNEKSFGQEIAEALVVSAVSTVATLAVFYAIGLGLELNNKRKARKAAKEFAKNDNIDPIKEQPDFTDDPQ